MDILTDRTDISYGNDLPGAASESEGSSYAEGCRLEMWENNEWTTILDDSRLNVTSMGNSYRALIYLRVNYSSLAGPLQPGDYRLLIPLNIGEEQAVLAAPFTISQFG